MAGGGARRLSRFRPEKLNDFLEAAYRFDLDDQAWLAEVMESARDVTVRVLTARAAAKLGVRSRAALLEHPDVRPLRPGT